MSLNNPFQNPKGSVSLLKSMISNRINSSIKKNKKSCVANLIFNSKGDLLLLQRAGTDDFHPSTWCLPGGGVDEAENPKAACVRETKEECGFFNPTVYESKLFSLTDVDIYYFTSYIKPTQEAFIMLDQNEHSKYVFCSIQKWLGMDLILSLKDHLKDILNIDADVFDIEKSQDGETSKEERSFDDGEDSDIEKAIFSGKDRKKLAKEGEAEKGGSYPIRNASDLSNAIKAFGRSKDKDATKAWIKKRAKELDMEDSLPEGWKEKETEIKKDITKVDANSYVDKDTDRFDNEVDTVEKAVEDLLEKAVKGEGSRGGKIIGHTKSGKPVYADKKASSYKDFSTKDHKEASSLHEKKGKLNYAKSEEARGFKNKEDKEKFKGESDKHHSLQEEHQKKSEKIIKDGGETSTGKKISYKENAGHTSYEKFTSADHREAGEHLKQKGDEHFSDTLGFKHGSPEFDTHSEEGERLHKLALNHFAISNAKKRVEDDKAKIKKAEDDELNGAFDKLIK